MCTRYIPPDQAAIEQAWQIKGPARPPWARELFRHGQGPFIRRARNDAGYSRELVVGQWGLIPHFADTPNIAYSTINARSEEMATKPSYKLPWIKAQRCVIPAWSFDEPCWETGRNVWWRFSSPEQGGVLAIAGLWATWLDRSTGEMLESYTMLTINADPHPLMSRMHKPDPKLSPDKQDKRSLVLIPPAQIDVWLAGSSAEARAMLACPADGDLVGVPLLMR